MITTIALKLVQAFTVAVLTLAACGSDRADGPAGSPGSGAAVTTTTQDDHSVAPPGGADEHEAEVDCGFVVPQPC